jgi:hypothetical protein
VVEERELDIFLHRKLVDQVEALEDEADVALARLGELGFGEAGHLVAVEHVRSSRRAIEHPHHVQKGRLAAARRAHDRDELAVCDVEIDIIERGRFDGVGAVGLREASHRKHCRVPFVSPRS